MQTPCCVVVDYADTWLHSQMCEFFKIKKFVWNCFMLFKVFFENSMIYHFHSTLTIDIIVSMLPILFLTVYTVQFLHVSIITRIIKQPSPSSAGVNYIEHSYSWSVTLTMGFGRRDELALHFKRVNYLIQHIWYNIFDTTYLIQHIWIILLQLRLIVRSRSPIE